MPGSEAPTQGAGRRLPRPYSLGPGPKSLVLKAFQARGSPRPWKCLKEWGSDSSPISWLCERPSHFSQGLSFHFHT